MSSACPLPQSRTSRSLTACYRTAVNLLYWLTLLQLHRPFFSRASPNAAQPSSTEKCLLAASHIVRLIKVQARGHGYRLVHPTFIQYVMSQLDSRKACQTDFTVSTSVPPLPPEPFSLCPPLRLVSRRHWRKTCSVSSKRART